MASKNQSSWRIELGLKEKGFKKIFLENIYDGHEKLCQKPYSITTWSYCAFANSEK